ncbi:MAG TPA: hypothetical protein DDX39_09385 [Bacteroidales bacterium]|nr:MAG: hypothetical protein A2W98_15290 [Bacteroidetes bacterium GWF2_33_38]OFY72695.1 MAG: hypothetical protein A2265_11640 [Bacteroidetes bacterium RIFOXYA12_FULL_33_9]OFY85917.1 MAG: hypothetical protein A2236_08760 [Bacteroidetes bacterium RIFOXYA2_FULL_33_7]HBF88841.1 hypothetical protein [Bacteroidales bacterium]
MKKGFRILLKYFIQKARKSRLLLSLFEAPIDVQSMNVSRSFTSQTGKSFNLYRDFRSKIKPGWENYLLNQGKKIDYSDEKLNKSIENGQFALSRILPIVNAASKKIKDSTILEIGCHLGSVSYLLSDMNAQEIYATDFTGYKAKSANSDDVSEKTLEAIDVELSVARENLRAKFKNGNKVKFYNDDICTSTLPKNKFDIIFSFDVLEHISDSNKAFETIASLLKPNGIAIHEYNPFFSLNGGHSACTLDFPWGHVRLSKTDFEKYIDEIRPKEKQLAKSFYSDGLNRMSISQLKEYSKKNGLEIVSILQFTKEQHVRMLTDEIVEECKANYPSIDIADLVAPKVIVILKK